MLRKVAVALFVLGLSIPIFAQKTKKVSGTYTYVIPETQSYTQAKEIAIQRAQLQILADTFGTAMDMSTTTTLGGEGAQSRGLSLSQVKGEWLETIGEPKLTRLFDGEQMAIRVEITGRVREIASASSEFTAKVLCGTPDLRFEQTTFFDGDAFYLYFQTPGDGYLTVYLYDGAGDVYCLLPYKSMGSGVFPVKGGVPYYFFSADWSDGVTPYGGIDEYTLTTSSDLEMNRLIVVFSPNYFTKALDSDSSVESPRVLPFRSFQKWLSRIRMEDRFVGVQNIDITIKQQR